MTAGLSAAALLAPVAGAAEPYGEAHRIGGFDSAYFNAGAYDGGQPADGKFLNPSAFAVDVADPDAPGGTAVYVVDSTSPQAASLGATPSRWRLQKLSEDGDLLGVATFTLPGGATETVVPQVPNITVDPGTSGAPGRVYLLVNSGDWAESRGIVAWSTHATGGRLDSPAGLPADTVTTATNGSNPAGILSTAAQINSSSTPAAPRGIAVVGDGENRSLALLSATPGGDGLTGASLTRIALAASGGTAVGDKLAGSWSGASLASDPLAPPTIATDQADGISRNPDGSLTVTIVAGGARGDAGRAANVTVVRVASDLASARVLESSINSTGGAPAGPDFSLWSAIALPAVYYYNNPGSAVVQLSERRFASLYSPYWDSVSPWSLRGFNRRNNVAVRLLAPVDDPGQPWDGTLSNPTPPTRSVVNTLGSVSGTGACAIGISSSGGDTNSNVGIAAGKNGSVWILTGGEDAGLGQGAGLPLDGRELIELAPGASSNPCSQPGSGTFDVKVGGQVRDAGRTITVPVGTTVDLDATALRGGAWGALQEWDLDGDTSNGYEQRAGFDADFPLRQPTALATRTFTRPGLQRVRSRVVGDFGTVEREATFLVQAGTPPVASFSASAAEALVDDEVAFDASGSTAPAGTTIANYRWDFGDEVLDSATPRVRHAFGAAGTYEVRLTVRGSDNQVSAAATGTVVVKTPTADRPAIRDPVQVVPIRRDPIPTPLPDTTPPAVAVKARAAAQAVALSIACPAGESRCAGKAALTVKTRVKVGKGRRARTKTRTVTVGSVSFALGGGQSRTVTIKLNGLGRALLKKGSVKVAISVTVADAAGNTAAKSLSITLRRAVKRKK